MIAVVDYGIGNLRSAEKAFQHVGAEARLCSDPAQVAAADAVVLPGVGAFGQCMAALRASGMEEPVRAALAGGVPFLGVCVGMQMLYEGSDESPGVDGLGVLTGVVGLLPDGVKRPQTQWNTLTVRPGTGGWLGGDEAGGPWVYFVHSYAAPDSEDVCATCDYGGPVTAAVQRGPLWATQFHPEKSGAAGLAMLGSFAAAAQLDAVLGSRGGR